MVRQFKFKCLRCTNLTHGGEIKLSGGRTIKRMVCYSCYQDLTAAFFAHVNNEWEKYKASVERGNPWKRAPRNRAKRFLPKKETKHEEV